MRHRLPNCRVGSWSGSTPNQTVAMGLTPRKTQTVANGPVLPPKTWHFKFTILAPMKYLSSDRITTQSIHTLCTISHSITSRFQICDVTSIRWLAIESTLFSLKFCHYFTTTLRISVRLRIRKSGKSWTIYILTMSRYNQNSNTQLEAKLQEPYTSDRGPVPTLSNTHCSVSSQGNKPAETKRVRFLAGSGTELNRTDGQNPDCWRVTRIGC